MDGTKITLVAVTGLVVAGSLKKRGSMALSDYGVTIEHTVKEGTIAKGETRPIKEMLKQNRFRWYRAGGFWFVPRTRGKAESPIDLDAVRAEAEAILSGEQEPPNVVDFRSRSRKTRKKTSQRRGHYGDITHLGPDGTSFSESSLYTSRGIRFGTSAPYKIGYVGPDRIGFADIPMVVVEMYGKESGSLVPIARQLAMAVAAKNGLQMDMGGSLVPIARQLAMAVAAKNGLQMDMGPPGLKIGRERLFTDENPSSPYFGKRKRLQEYTYQFEVKGVDPDFLEAKLGPKLSKRGLFGWISRRYDPVPNKAQKLTRQEIIEMGHLKE
jgi:hypothetical protein